MLSKRTESVSLKKGNSSFLVKEINCLLHCNKYSFPTIEANNNLISQVSVLGIFQRTTTIQFNNIVC